MRECAAFDSAGSFFCLYPILMGTSSLCNSRRALCDLSLDARLLEELCWLWSSWWSWRGCGAWCCATGAFLLLALDTSLSADFPLLLSTFLRRLSTAGLLSLEYSTIQHDSMKLCSFCTKCRGARADRVRNSSASSTQDLQPQGLHAAPVHTPLHLYLARIFIFGDPSRLSNREASQQGLQMAVHLVVATFVGWFHADIGHHIHLGEAL